MDNPLYESERRYKKLGDKAQRLAKKAQEAQKQGGSDERVQKLTQRSLKKELKQAKFGQRQNFEDFEYRRIGPEEFHSSAGKIQEQKLKVIQKQKDAKRNYHVEKAVKSFKETQEPKTKQVKDSDVFGSKREARQWKRGKDNMPSKGQKDGPAVSLGPDKFAPNEYWSKREARQWKRGKDNMPSKGQKDGPSVSLGPDKFVSNEYWSKRKARQWKREGKKEIRAAAMAEKARQRMNAMNYRA